ncbi:hypothetical protein KXW84_005456 [Aspergillus fumigatus]|nr:hypothetical protein KXW84_005456 [Aspergillus fumigatus]
MFINNFSAAGGNTALLMEDAPLREITGQDRPRDRIQLRLLRAQRSKTIEDSDTDEDEREGDGYK